MARAVGGVAVAATLSTATACSPGADVESTAARTLDGTLRESGSAVVTADGTGPGTTAADGGSSLAEGTAGGAPVGLDRSGVLPLERSVPMRGLVPLERISLTDPTVLTPTASVYQLAPTGTGTVLAIGAARRPGGGSPVATVWELDPTTGSELARWELPSPPGVAAAARDAVVLDGGLVVAVGAVYARGGAVPVAWRIAGDRVEDAFELTCSCGSAEAERVVVDDDGVVFAVGAERGTTDRSLVWASGSSGAGWTRAADDGAIATGASLVAPIEAGVVVLTRQVGWIASVYEFAGGGQIRLAERRRVDLGSAPADLHDLGRVGDTLWIAGAVGGRPSVWRSADGVGWQAVAGDVTGLGSGGRVDLLGVGQIGGAVALPALVSTATGRSYDTIVPDASTGGFRRHGAVPVEWEPPDRYREAWPIAATGDEMVVLGPSWAGSPDLMIAGAGGAGAVPVGGIPPARRERREVVTRLVEGVGATLAIVSPVTAGADRRWREERPRVVVLDGDGSREIALAEDVLWVAGAVAAGDGFDVAVWTPDGTSFVPISRADGWMFDVGRAEITTALFATTVVDAGSIVIEAAGTAPVEHDPDGESGWTTLPEFPIAGAELLTLCADDTVTVAIVRSPSGRVVGYGRDRGAGSWRLLAELGETPGAGHPPACSVSAGSIAFVVPPAAAAAGGTPARWTTVDVAGTGEVNEPLPVEWADVRVTSILPGSTARGVATGVRPDGDRTSDAIAWPVLWPRSGGSATVVGGPGLQEAHTASESARGRLVGGTDDGEAVIWIDPA